MSFQEDTPLDLRFTKRADLIEYLYARNRPVPITPERIIDEIIAMKYYTGEKRSVYEYLLVRDIPQNESEQLRDSNCKDIRKYFNLMPKNTLYGIHWDIKDLNEFDNPNEYEDEYDCEDVCD